MSEKHTPGPWAWFGSTRTDMYLATTHSGRRYVMGFKRKGMRGAEPTFQINHIMVPASSLAIYAVSPEATSADDPSVYRHDIVGFRSADACLIAAAPELLNALRELLAHASFVGIAPHYEDLARAAIAKAEGRIPDIQIKGAE